MSDLGRRTAGSIVWQASNYALIAVMTLIFLIVSARLIPAEDFGAFAIVSVVIAVITQFSEVGVGAALVQRATFNRAHVSIAFWTALVVSAVLYMAVWGLAIPIGHFYGDDELVALIRVAAIALLLAGVAVVPQSMLIRNLGFRALFVANCGAYFVGHLLVGIVLAYLGYGAWALVLAFVATRALLTLLFWVLNPVAIGVHFGSVELRDIAYFGSGLTVIRILNSLAESLDKLVLGALAPLATLGLYERMIYTVRIPLTYIGHVVDAPLFSVMSRAQSGEGDRTGLFITATAICTVLGATIASYAVLFAEQLVDALLGEAWLAGVPAFSALGLIIALNLQARMCDIVVRAHNRMYRSIVPKACYAVGVSGGVALGWQFAGLPGAALGVVAGCVLHLLLMSRVAMTILDLRLGYWLREILPGARVAALLILKNGALVYAGGLGTRVPDAALLALALATDAIVVAGVTRWRPDWFGARLAGTIREVIAFARVASGRASP